MAIQLSVHYGDSQAKGRGSTLAALLEPAGIHVMDVDAPDAIRALIFEEASGEVLAQLKSVSRGGRERVIAISTCDTAAAGHLPWKLLRAGASDVLVWADGACIVEQLTARVRRWHHVDSVVRSELVRRNAIGTSAAWIACLRRVVEVAVFGSGPLLLTGESGTGKELVARLVHALDPRASRGELVVLDCTTVVPSLAGSEFFGHERGAFTGAAQSRDGAFALADGGTLFLDEVGELEPTLQAQLLRVVQEKHFKRVGGNTWHDTNFRLICATHRDLEGEIAKGGFRGDFFHRIARTRCVLPPLRERREDILELSRHFLRESRPDAVRADFDPIVARYLNERPYPGNVRELRNLIGRIAERHVGGGFVSIGDVPPEDLPLDAEVSEFSDTAIERVVADALSAGVGLKELGRLTSEAAIRLALEAEGGNLQRAARLLKVTDRALQMRRAQRVA